DVVAYAEGRAPLTDERLAEVFRAWLDGDQRLSGDVAARALMRWHREVPEPPVGLPVRRAPLVGVLADRHADGAVPITSLKVRDDFNAAFQQKLADPRLPFDQMVMPEYLTRTDPDGRLFGHSGFDDIAYENGRTTYENVRDLVEEVAPGLLASGAELWDGQGRRIGRMQGNVDALQAVLAHGRDQTIWNQAIAGDGQTFYLVNPVGWLLTDIVEINLTDRLTSQPQVLDYRRKRGLEVYSHGYIGTSESRSRDGSQGWMYAKFSPAGDRASGPLDLKTAEGHHRGTTHAESAVSEQTVYDWADHYAVRMEHELSVNVRRLKMSGRPLNNVLLTGFKGLTGHGRSRGATFEGTLDIQVPHALAEAGSLHGPEGLRDVLPLPKLPGNAFVTGVLADDLPAVANAMMAKMFGPKWYEKVLGAKRGDPNALSSLSLPMLLSRPHLANHLREATGGERYEFPQDLFVEGDSSERAKMWLEGDLFDTQVIGRMADGGTGTGRYIKHQSGTTASSSSDQIRTTGEYAISGNDTINPLPKPPEGTEAPPQRPDHSWEFKDSGSRTTSGNQSSAGTENYRREQHAKELGAMLLIRMRGQFWLGAQKMRHHLFRKPTTVGTPIRSDPVTGDVYVQMFEAQYRTFLADQAADAQRAQRALLNRVDPGAWAGLGTARDVSLAPLLLRAAALEYSASRAHHHLVRQLREQGDAGRPLVLTHGAAERVARYRAILRWAETTVNAALRAGADADGSARERLRVERERRLRAAGNTDPAPRLLDLYGQRRAATDRLLFEDLNGSLDHEITTIINEVNDVHALRPDNTVGAPAALPPEVAMLGLDPVYLARDVAHELGSHVRLDVEQPDGTVHSHWADPSGRIHAFDPATFDDLTLSADEATRAGLWHDDVREIAAGHEFGPVELGHFYRTSWSHQRTFEQAVLSEVAERRERMRAVNEALPGLFDRAVNTSTAWRPVIAGIEPRHTRAAADVARTEAEIRRVEDRLREIEENRIRLTLDENPDQAALARLRAEATRLNADRRRQEGVLIGQRRTLAPLTRSLDAARRWAGEAEDLRTDLRAVGRGTGQATWTEAEVRRAGERLRAAEAILDRRRTGLAYRTRVAPTMPEVIDGLHRTLRDAGPGAVSLVVTSDAAGTGGRFVVVHHGNRIHWFEAETGLPVEPPENPTRLHSLDLGGDGVLLDPPAELREAPPRTRSFTQVRDLALATVAPHLNPELAPPAAREPDARSRSALYQSVVAFENQVAARNESLLRLAAAPARRIVSLSIAARDGVPDDATVYRNEQGQHGVGPAGLTTAGWTRLGALAEFRPVSWLTTGAPRRPVTVQDIARNDLGAAVRYLSRDGRTPEQRVREAFGEHPGLLVETADRVPADLPPGTWLWFTGPTGTGAALATARGYRVFLTRENAAFDVSRRSVPATLNAEPHTIVIGRTGKAAGTGTGTGKSGETSTTVGKNAQLTNRQNGTHPPERTPNVALEDPLPADPHLYVGEDGSHRVAADGLAEDGWTHQGALTSYAPISWLIRRGPEQPTTGADVVRDELGPAVAFLTEATVIKDATETVRTILAARTGLRVERTDTLPAKLPPGTLLYVAGPARTAAAVMLPGGGYRFLADDGRTGVSSDERDLADLDDGWHTFVIARPVQVPRPRGGKGKETAREQGVEGPAEHALRLEAQAFDEDRLRAALSARRLRAVDVPADRNCFYHSLIVIAGEYLERHIPGVRRAADRRAAIRALREWLADRLEADFAVAAQGLPSRYADFFHVAEGRGTIREQQARLVDQIRQMDNWRNEAGDLVAHLAAYELGLRLTLVQDRYVTTLGPEGGAEVSFIRRPGHFQGARSTRTDAPAIPWKRFGPAPETSADAAREQFDRQAGWLNDRRTRAVADLATLARGLSPDAARELDARVRQAVAGFRDGYAANGRRDVPAHVRAQQRLDVMGREARELEYLLRAYGGPAPSVAEGVRAQTHVSDWFVEEVNLRLLGFGGGWLGGRVDRGQIQEALRHLPQGGPTDPRAVAREVVQLMVLGGVTRTRGGSSDALVRPLTDLSEAGPSRTGPGRSRVRGMDRLLHGGEDWPRSAARYE
ncbi:MAG: hypothetical protein ACRDP6_47665, partial [Actinoallomurus sp.]